MEEPLKIYRHQLEEMLEEARLPTPSLNMEDKGRIAELLVEPDISGMDWNLGSQILMNWKAELPDRILSELGYTRQPELTKISDEEIYRIASTRYTIIAANEAAQAQLEHDQETIRGGMVEGDEELEKGGVITDGFGSSWSVVCPKCLEKSMYVVRPGKVQCGNCD